MEAADAFEAWWPHYPHKVGKGAARKAFAKAIKKVTLAELIEGVERYKRAKPAWQNWCHPSTWLNQERWNDEYAATGNGRESLDQQFDRLESFLASDAGAGAPSGQAHARQLPTRRGAD